MATALSPRLAAIIAALPLWAEARVLEIGCGPGAAARAIAERLTSGHIRATDRSANAIRQARTACAEQLATGRLSLRQVSAEELTLDDGEEPYDLVFAIRVGALDGRHPKAGEIALRRIAEVTTPQARLYIDGGDPLRELKIPRS